MQPRTILANANVPVISYSTTLEQSNFLVLDKIIVDRNFEITANRAEPKLKSYFIHTGDPNRLHLGLALFAKELALSHVRLQFVTIAALMMDACREMVRSEFEPSTKIAEVIGTYGMIVIPNLADLDDFVGDDDRRMKMAAVDICESLIEHTLHGGGLVVGSTDPFVSAATGSAFAAWATLASETIEVK